MFPTEKLLRWLRQASEVTLLIEFNFFNSKVAIGHTVFSVSEPIFETMRFIESVGKIESPENVKGDFPVIEFVGMLGNYWR